MMKSYDGSVLQSQYSVDPTFNERIRAGKARHKLAGTFSIAPFEAKAFLVKKGQTVRIIDSAGPQVATLALWDAHNRRESFNAMYTWAAASIHLTVDMQLWSRMPWFVPMATCIESTVAESRSETHCHHHWIGTHCHPKVIEMRTGRRAENSCHENLLRAVAPFGIREEDVHDSISLFQKFYLDVNDGRKLCVMASDAKAGDSVTLYAEKDLLVAVSVCPYGDGPTYRGDDRSKLRPLGVEIHDTGVEPREFPKRTDWRPTWKGQWVAPGG